MTRSIMQWAFAAVVALLLAVPASAQCDPSYDPDCIGGGDGLGPDIGITPDGGTWQVYDSGTEITPAKVAVRIVLTDVDGIRQSSVRLNGAVPDASWSWSQNTSGTHAFLQRELVFTSAQTYTLAVYAADNAGAETTTSVTYRIEGNDPRLPIVSLDPYHNEFRNTAQGYATLGYALPGYTSMDQERTTGLFYSSEQGDPNAFVMVDVTPDPRTGSQVTQLSIHILDKFGFLVGREIFYRKAGGNKQRLAAQWSMRDRPTGAYDYTVAIRSYYSDGTHAEKRTKVRVLILNERNSRYGAGWSVAGVQRIHSDASGVLLNEGNGIARWFVKGTCSAVECYYTTPAGDFSRLRSHSENGVWKWTRTYVNGAQTVFDSRGLMTAAVDALGRTTAYQWVDVQNVPVLWQITDPAGKVTSLSYHTNGYLRQITDHTGRFAQLTYNAANDVTRIAGPKTLDLTYGAQHNVWTYTDERGTWEIGYHAPATVAYVKSPEILLNGVAVRPMTRYVSIQAATVTLFDSTAGTAANPQYPLTVEEAFVRVDDPLRHLTRILIDRYGNVTKSIDPLGITTSNTWNSDGLPVSSSEPNGVTTTYSWNGRGQLLSKEVNLATVYHASYGLDGKPEYEYDDGMGRWFEYGSRGEVARSWYGAREDSTRNGTTYQYDANYQLIATVGPAGDRREWSYANPWKNTSSARVFLEDGSIATTSYAYDNHGRRQAVTNAAGFTTTTEYDALNRPVRVTDPQQGVTQFTYTGAWLTKVTDAASKAYQYAYNALGWLLSETFPDGKVRTYRYDEDGRTVGHTDRRAAGEIVYAYDASHRLTSRTVNGAATTFAYPDSFTTVVSNAEATETIHRSGGLGIARTTVALAGGLYEVHWLRDPLNPHIVTGKDVKHYVNGVLQRTDSIRYTRDTDPIDTSLGRTFTIQDPSGRSTMLAYDTSGRHVRTAFPNGVTQYLWHTIDGRIWANTFSSSTVNQKLGGSFTHDLLRRLSSRLSVPGDTKWSYEYDALGRIATYNASRSSYPSWCNPSYETCEPLWMAYRYETYTYDPAGNRTDRNATLQPNSNRYQSFDGFTLVYDAEGNVKRRYKASVLDQYYTWDGLGQLTSVKTNGTVVDYGYSGLGRRVRRTQDGQSRYSLYSDDDLLMELDHNGAPFRIYTHLPGMDQPLSVRAIAAGQNFDYYYVMEAPGHVTGLLNTSGGISAEYRYGPFGDVENASDATGQPLRYMAREFDSTTRLYYVRNRWYDPALGRFLSEDPSGLEGGINPYVYAGNDPVNRRDPTGLQDCRRTIHVTKQVYDEVGDKARQVMQDYWGVCLEVVSEQLDTSNYDPVSPSLMLGRPRVVRTLSELEQTAPWNRCNPAFGPCPGDELEMSYRSRSSIGPYDPYLFRLQTQIHETRLRERCMFWLKMHIGVIALEVAAVGAEGGDGMGYTEEMLRDYGCVPSR